MKTRQQIIDEAKRILRELELDENTLEYWNRNVRKPHEKVIPFDPDGDMAELKAKLKGLLATI